MGEDGQTDRQADRGRAGGVWSWMDQQEKTSEGRVLRRVGPVEMGRQWKNDQKEEEDVPLIDGVHRLSTNLAGHSRSKAGTQWRDNKNELAVPF